MNILIVNGNPDRGAPRFSDALVDAYATAARNAGHVVETIRIAELDFPVLRSKENWESAVPCSDILAAQASLQRAEHLVLVFPLWLGDMPALLKAFLEQLLRPGFAFSPIDGKGFPRRKLRGKSARIVVTMGMPAFVYRWYFRAHSLKNLERNILAFCGFGPIRSILLGNIENPDPRDRREALRILAQLGRKGR
ncbi:MAG: NAD(P)H-dependent oxidoreductase [Pseudomonadota bacterium]|nr:NAD(P)H-dependent oxidoreductase [Pseudomonadota bacterium]